MGSSHPFHIQITCTMWMWRILFFGVHIFCLPSLPVENLLLEENKICGKMLLLCSERTVFSNTHLQSQNMVMDHDSWYGSLTTTSKWEEAFRDHISYLGLLTSNFDAQWIQWQFCAINFRHYGSFPASTSNHCRADVSLKFSDIYWKHKNLLSRFSPE